MTTNKQNGSGIARIFKAARCSLQGFVFAWKFESAFRQEALLVCALLPASFFLAQSHTHWYILLITLIFLLFAELLNSAVEALADRITLEHDEAIKRAKDIGSAAVFLALSLLVIIWGHSVLIKIFS